MLDIINIYDTILIKYALQLKFITLIIVLITPKYKLNYTIHLYLFVHWLQCHLTTDIYMATPTIITSMTSTNLGI